MLALAEPTNLRSRDYEEDECRCSQLAMAAAASLLIKDFRESSAKSLQYRSSRRRFHAKGKRQNTPCPLLSMMFESNAGTALLSRGTARWRLRCLDSILNIR